MAHMHAPPITPGTPAGDDEIIPTAIVIKHIPFNVKRETLLDIIVSLLLASLAYQNSGSDPFCRHRLQFRHLMPSTIILTSRVNSVGSPSPISVRPPMQTPSLRRSTVSTSRAASSVWSTRKCYRQERRSGSKGRRPSVGCAPCSWRRSRLLCSNNISRRRTIVTQKRALAIYIRSALSTVLSSTAVST